MHRLEFWYEFASTYSYPAAMRAEREAQAAGVELRWRPFLLGPLFAELGWTTSPFNLQPDKGAYMWRDVARTCRRLGLPFERPDPFPQNGLLAARIAIALPEGAPRARFSRAVYRAEFAEGAQIAEPAVLAELLTREGQDAPALLAAASAAETKQALRAATKQAKAHGVFGAPTWRCADGEIFWGNDRLEEALAWAVALG